MAIVSHWSPGLALVSVNMLLTTPPVVYIDLFLLIFTLSLSSDKEKIPSFLILCDKGPFDSVTTSQYHPRKYLHRWQLLKNSEQVNLYRAGTLLVEAL